LNLCRSCGEDFSSIEGFDAHRVGTHDYTYSEGLKLEPAVEDGRRCLYVWELEGLGWERNASNRWFDPTRVARARERFGRPENRPPKLTEAVHG
jgi:hypothetical protein